MRERITFIQKLGHSLEASTIKVSDNELTGPDVDAVREDRLTFALDELPSELHSLLKAAHELHIRWVSPVAYETVSPLLARLPPGLHIFYTPGKAGDAASTRLCSSLSKIFGYVACSTPNESFTSLPSDRFSHSAAFQYFQPLESLESFVTYAKSQLCQSSDASCKSRLDNLTKAATLDVSYDTISHALKTTALWPYSPQPIHAISRPNVRTEVGVLSAEKTPTMEVHELGVSGLLTVVGQDTKPSVTMFSFPSRHRDAESFFSAKFLTPTGLHPTLQLRLTSSANPDPSSFCTPHAYFTLPKTIFADKYQLSDSLFLASKNLTSLRYTSQPVDLEAPEYVMKIWGSSILVELAPPKTDQGAWTAEIPLHLRYLAPTNGGYKDIEIPYPAVFWACNAEEGTKFPNNPFEKVNLGYDGLFGPRTVFWHVDPKPEAGYGARTMSGITVPVLDLDKAKWVNVGTAAVVALGFLWVVSKLAGVLWKTGYGRTPVADEKKKQ